MRTKQSRWTKASGWSSVEPPSQAQWVLYSAAPEALDDRVFASLRARYPSAHLLGGKTGGEIAGILGHAFATVGFYSYGEIAPGGSGFSDLHNQTMTVTTFGERRAA